MPLARMVTLLLLPALASWKKACTIPVTVPRKPIMGAPAAVVASQLKPFSSLAISMLPTFSMVTSTSFMGRPMRVTPFSIMRE